MQLQGDLSKDGYIDNHYTRTLQTALRTDPLSGEHEADVCIIGGGIAGISAAWELTIRGSRWPSWKQTGCPGRSGAIADTERGVCGL